MKQWAENDAPADTSNETFHHSYSADELRVNAHFCIWGKSFFNLLFLHRMHAWNWLRSTWQLPDSRRGCCCWESWGFPLFQCRRTKWCVNDRNTSRHTNTCLTNTGVSPSFPSNADREKNPAKTFVGRVWWELTQLDWLIAACINLYPQSTIYRTHGHRANKNAQKTMSWQEASCNGNKNILTNSATIHI